MWETHGGGLCLDKEAHDSLKAKLKYFRRMPSEVHQVQLSAFAEKAAVRHTTSLTIQKQQLELKTIPRARAKFGFIGFGVGGVVVGSILTAIIIRVAP